MKVLFKRLHPEAQLPSYAHPGDAGMDARSIEDVVIPPGGRALVHTGIAAELPPRAEIQVRSRSGLALKKGVMVLNSPGTVDSGYRGEICVILANLGEEPFEIRKGDRIAQLVVASTVEVEVAETDSIGETDRGAGGFGSTGV